MNWTLYHQLFRSGTQELSIGVANWQATNWYLVQTVCHWLVQKLSLWEELHFWSITYGLHPMHGGRIFLEESFLTRIHVLERGWLLGWRRIVLWKKMILFFGLYSTSLALVHNRYYSPTWWSFNKSILFCFWATGEAIKFEDCISLFQLKPSQICDIHLHNMRRYYCLLNSHIKLL